MRVLLARSRPPFADCSKIDRVMDGLQQAIREHDHQVDRIVLPAVDDQDALACALLAASCFDVNRTGLDVVVDVLISLDLVASQLRHARHRVWLVDEVRDRSEQLVDDLLATALAGHPEQCERSFFAASPAIARCVEIYRGAMPSLLPCPVDDGEIDPAEAEAAGWQAVIEQLGLASGRS